MLGDKLQIQTAEVAAQDALVVTAVAAFEKASGRKIPVEFAPRRAGDVATCYADPAKARNELGWEAKRGVDEMCADTWKWQSGNPNGYKEG